MPQTVALSELKTRIREVADIDTSSPSNHHITDDFLKRRINAHAKKLRLKLSEKSPEWFAKNGEFTLTNTSSYPLATHIADFATLVAAYVKRPSGAGVELRELEKFQLVGHEFARLKSIPQGSFDTYQYRLNGPDMTVLPLPPGGNQEKIEIYYIPTFTDLSADGDTIDGLNGFEDWIVYSVAIDVANRQDDFEKAAGFFQARGVIDAQIEALAASRDEGRPARIADTDTDRPGWPEDIRSWTGYH